jgi:pSer/pThr/pTyr-binding forkhead associated (FHA) protein
MDKGNLKLEFENNPSRNYIITCLENRDDIIDYEVEMINNNPTSGALNIEIRQFNDKIKVIYDTTGKIPAKEYLKGRTIKKGEFISILKNMASCLLECKNYFLDEKKYFMNLDTIYVDEKDLSVYLLYFPFNLNIDEDINIVYRNIVKNLIIDFVSLEEKNSENTIQKTLKYLRNDEFTISEFRDYLQEFGEENLKIIYDNGSTKKEKPQVIENRHENINVNNVNEKTNYTNKDELLNNKQGEKKPINMNGYIMILLIQLISFGIVGVISMFGTMGIIVIISVATVIAADLALTIFIIKAKMVKKKLGYVKRKADTGFINREMEKSKPNNRSSKREIVTEMSFDTELLDAKTAFLMSKKAGTVEKIFINKDQFKIGRLAGEVDYVSDNSAVGKVHAEIKIDNDKYYLMDLSSRNGTFINGQRINSNELYEIKNDDSVVFANSEFKFFIN